MSRLQQLLCFCFVTLLVGCGSQPQRKPGDKTRDTVARATERAKPEIQWSAKQVGRATKWMAEETLAAVEGFFEGWNASSHPINLNSADIRQLESLPGITQDEARRIIQDRPYRDKAALVTQGIISESRYRSIKDRVTAE